MMSNENIDDDDEHFICTPPDIADIAKDAVGGTLPEYSKEIYEKAYQDFVKWKRENKISSSLFSENVLIAYFKELSTKFKRSTLWVKYSMLRSTILLHHNINIKNYHQLKMVIKRAPAGTEPKQAKYFQPEEINRFLKEAPDDLYLVHKVRKKLVLLFSN